MADVIVCGAGVVGLGAAMLLARDGHDVTVLEGDPALPPADPIAVWDEWDRKGVAQFRQPHNLLPAFRRIMDTELPGATERLLEFGCTWCDAIDPMPPPIQDRSARPDDDKFRFVTGRRPVIEAALASFAAEQPALSIRRGVKVRALKTDTNGAGALKVTGVRTDDGDIAAGLVVDAMGRRTKLTEWLEAAGASAPYTESEDSGFTYYTRYFSGPTPPHSMGPRVVLAGSISLLTLPGDNGTWSVTVFTASDDKEMRAVKDPATFSAVVSRFPLHRHWLDGAPVTDVLAMSGVLDRYRRFVLDGRPVATGVVAVGDSWACTNPSAGRGMSVGTIQAQVLRDAVREHGVGTDELALGYDAETEARVSPFYFSQIAADRRRVREMLAHRDGVDPPAPDAAEAAFVRAASYDPDVFRAMVELRTCMALPQDVLGRPGLADRIATAAANPAISPPIPSRAELLALVG